MLAKAYAKKVNGGNGMRWAFFAVYFILWLATSFVAVLYALIKFSGFFKSLGIAALDSLFGTLVTATDPIATPLFGAFGNIFPVASLKIMMLLTAALWLILLWAWVRLLCNRYALCITETGHVLLSLKIGQRIEFSALAAAIGIAETMHWYGDDDFRIPAREGIYFGGSLLVFFVKEAEETCVPDEASAVEAAPATEEAAAEEASPTEEAASDMADASAKAAEGTAPVAETAIGAIFKKADMRERQRLASVAATEETAVPQAPVAQFATPAAATDAPVAVAAEAPVEDASASPSEDAADMAENEETSWKPWKDKRIDLSFTAQLIQANDEVKGYYSELKNEFLSYNRVKSRISWKHDAFSFDQVKLAKIVVRETVLYLYLALNPGDYDRAKYPHKDKSGIKSHEGVPMMLRIKSNLALRRAKFLISELMSGKGIERGETADLDYVSWYAKRDLDVLIEEKLAKELKPEE